VIRDVFFERIAFLFPFHDLRSFPLLFALSTDLTLAKQKHATNYHKFHSKFHHRTRIDPGVRDRNRDRPSAFEG
jgi:hypothetical protein